MSRRTKLTILATFLGLCGIALALAVTSWRPKNPLRISLAPGQELLPQASPSEYFLAPYHIVVENTGDAEIHFFDAVLDDATHPGRGIYPAAVLSSPEWENFTHAAAGAHWAIPPHSSIRCTVLPSGGGDLSTALRGNMMVRYEWRSPLNLRYVQLRSWFRDQAPSRLHGFLREPDCFQDSTPLEVPAPPPASTP